MLKRLYLMFRRAVFSFWFLPVAMSLGATLLFAITVTIDGLVDLDHLNRYGLPFGIGADGARQLTATIAGSLITVASLVFSMTLVALTVAAGNIGARLLVRYMRHRNIQITLGLFLAGFIYALLTLSAIGNVPDAVPRLSVVTAMAFAICSFLWLAYAFHDLAETIQVDRAVARLAAALRRAIESLHGAGPQSDDFEDALTEEPLSVNAAESGYVQSIDNEKLVETARGHKLALDVLVKPGVLIMQGEPVIDVHLAAHSSEPDEEMKETLQGTIIVGDIRSDLDDPFFCLRLITEIAARALSPGINDLYTAMACIDHMAQEIRHLLNVGLPKRVLCDADGKPRVRLAVYDLDDFLDGAFEELRRCAAPHPALMARLIDRLGRLSKLIRDPQIRDGLLDRAQIIADQTKEQHYSLTDRRLIADALKAAHAHTRHDVSPVHQED